MNVQEKLKEWYWRRFGERPTCDRDDCDDPAMGYDETNEEYFCFVHEPGWDEPVSLRFVNWRDYRRES